MAEEIVVQRMSADVSGKQQKYTRIGPQEYVSFEHEEMRTSKTPRSTSGLRSKNILSVMYWLESAGHLANSPIEIVANHGKPVWRPRTAILCGLLYQFLTVTFRHFLLSLEFIFQGANKTRDSFCLLRVSYLVVAFQRSILIGNDLHSFGFYKPYIEHFSVWNMGHLFARWPVLSSQYITDKMFFDLRPEVLLAGVFDVRISSCSKDTYSWGPILVYFCCLPETSALIRCTTISSATVLSSPVFLPFLLAF